MASYNTNLTWAEEQAMGSWGSGGSDYCNFGYSNVVRNGNQITFNWDLYIRQTSSQNYDRWALGSDQLGVSNGTIKGHGSSWSQYPLGYYNYSNNNGASSQGGNNSYGNPKTATVTVPAGQNYVDISVILKNTGLNDGWVTPYGDSSTYPNVNKTFRISGVPLATYNVAYDANGGTGAPGSQTKTAGVALTLSNTSPSKANTTTTWSTSINANGGTGSVSSVSATATQYWGFTYWKSSYDNTTYNPGASYTTDASTTMVAQWYATGEATMTLPTADKFTKTGYVCIGFDSNPNATTPTYAPGSSYYTTANGNTLYAIYRAAPKNKIYTKVAGTYKQGDCYVKVNGVWKLADAVYVKVNGGWKEASL